MTVKESDRRCRQKRDGRTIGIAARSPFRLSEPQPIKRYPASATPTAERIAANPTDQFIK
jgi:hypothetical protein